MYHISDYTTAKEICDRIHQYLTENRVKYNAMCWMDEPLQNHSNPDVYAVSLPPEWPEILTEAEAEEISEILPPDWFPQYDEEIT